MSDPCRRCYPINEARDALIAEEAKAQRSPFAHRPLTDEERDRFEPLLHEKEGDH